MGTYSRGFMEFEWYIVTNCYSSLRLHEEILLMALQFDLQRLKTDITFELTCW